MKDMPPDPIGPISDSAAQFHEMYVTIGDAGFTDDQAFQLLKLLIFKSLAEAT